VRVALGAAILIALWIVAERTGLRKNASADPQRAFVEGAGAWGGLAYVGAFVVGSLLQVPGTIFLLGARVAYGTAFGGALAYAGALAAVSVTFLFARGVGGRAFEEIRWATARKLLAGLEKRPIRTIVILRTVFWMSPPLNYALAMSTVRFRDYFVGSALGLVAPVAAVMIFSDAILSIASKLM
jgi:uncharacterized membrane protein YdjX (TVP38/TMEM64 family)